MALKESTETAKKSSFTMNYFKSGIIGNLKVLIVITALNLLAFPVALISVTDYMHRQHEVGEYYYSSSAEWFVILAIIFTAIAILAGVVIAMNNFSYLYKKQNVDMYLSLPLKNSQRFLCDYFSGLVCYLIPFLFAGVITIIISLFSMNIVPEMGKELAAGMHLPGLIIRCYLGVASVMIMLYTLTVLVASICGSLFETLFYTVVINGLIPGMIAIVTVISLSGAFGIAYEDYITPLISKTSPVGALIGLGLYEEANGEEYILSAGFAVKYCLTLIAVSALYAIAAYLLYRKRKAEDVSKPFVYNIFYYIIMTCIMLGMSAFIILEDDFLVPLIIFMAVVYLIFEVVNKRGFKKFRYSLLRCVLTIAGCIGVSLLCGQTKGFGIAYKVPNVDSVKSVTINYLGPETDPDYYYHGLDNSITVVDESTIENIIEAQKSIIKKYDERNISGWDYWAFDTDTVRVTLKYKLKNGTSLTREYEMTSDELYYLDTVCHDSNYEKEAAKQFENYMDMWDTVSVENVFISDYYEDVRTNEDGFAKKLSAAYARDLANRSVEQLRCPYETPLAKLGRYTEGFYVYSWDENTINVLLDFGVDVYELSERTYEDRDYDDSMIIRGMTRYDPTYCRDGDKITEIAGRGRGYYNGYDYENYMSYGIVYTEQIYELEKELIESAVPYYTTTEPLYKLITDNGQVFVIPSEHTETAEELYKIIMRINNYRNSYYDDVYVYDEYPYYQ